VSNALEDEVSLQLHNSGHRVFSKTKNIIDVGSNIFVVGSTVLDPKIRVGMGRAISHEL